VKQIVNSKLKVSPTCQLQIFDVPSTQYTNYWFLSGTTGYNLVIINGVRMYT